MAGARIDIVVDDKLVQQQLGRLVAEIGDPTEPLEEIGSYLVAATNRRFEQEQDPSGKPWKPSERAKATGGKTLQHTGRLRRSITYRVQGDSLAVGTNVIYAAPHQFGWPEKSLPQRSFLGVDESDERAILQILERSLEEAVSP